MVCEKSKCHMPTYLDVLIKSSNRLFLQGDSFSNSKATIFPFYRAVTNLENLSFHDNLVTYAGKDDDAPYFHDASMLLFPSPMENIIPPLC